MTNINDLNHVLNSKILPSLDEDIEDVSKIFIILYKGTRLTTRSGKSSWSTSGAAKLAFHAHIKNIIWWANRDGLDVTKKEVLDHLVKSGLLEFKEIDE